MSPQTILLVLVINILPDCQVRGIGAAVSVHFVAIQLLPGHSVPQHSPGAMPYHRTENGTKIATTK